MKIDRLILGAVAALLILSESIRELIQGPKLGSLDLGLAVLVVCAAANAALGLHLKRVGDETTVE